MATLEEILKLDSMSQVSDPKKCITVAPRLESTSAHEAQRTSLQMLGHCISSTTPS